MAFAEAPTRWLLKNTDTFAGFAHCINSYLAGVSLAAKHNLGLIHRPQTMAHGLGFAFVDFLDSDPRGLVPPVYAPTLASNATTMLLEKHPVQLYIQVATAVTNATTVARQVNGLPPDSLLWLRKGRATFPDEVGCAATAAPEVCYAGLWLRERFWQATMARSARRHHSAVPLGSIRSRRTIGVGAARLTAASNNHATNGGPIRIAVHVRRGDVYYLGPKTRLPHPHWVETVTVLDMLLGVRKALDMPLQAPAVQVAVYTEKGWLRNDTHALRAIAPDATIHMDSTPAATVNALVELSMADVLIMGSSGFSQWAGIFSCGIKIGQKAKPHAEPLPMRFLTYASTITTRTGAFWPEVGEPLRSAWVQYWACRRDPACRRSLCRPHHIASDSVWTRSALARQQIANSQAVQWRLPELVLWPNDEAIDTRIAQDGSESSALADLRAWCSSKTTSGSSQTTATAVTAPRRAGLGHGACLRNAWLHNLTAFLAARKKVPKGFITLK